MSYYSLKSQRIIDYCNPNIHRTGLIHPARNIPVHDFLYCYEGEWEIWQNGVPYVMRKDDLLILHAGIDHYGKIPCQPGTAVFFLHIYPDPEDVFSEYMRGKRDGFAEIPPLLHCQNQPRIGRLFKEITETFWHESETSRERSSLLVNMLLLRASQITESVSQEYDPLVERCRSLLLMNPDRFLDAPEIASELFVSERKIRDLFKESFGMTPLQYQREMKMNRAVALMLEYPDMQFKEISANLGYSFESHFNSNFREKFGLSPSVYREKLKSGEINPDMIFRKADSKTNSIEIFSSDGSFEGAFKLPFGDDETVWFHTNGRICKNGNKTLKIVIDRYVGAELFDGTRTYLGEITVGNRQIEDFQGIVPCGTYAFKKI